MIARSFARREGELKQTDIYFHVKHGRLKLRIFNAKSAELIFYLRDNAVKQRWSNYEVLPVKFPKQMKTMLSKSLGVLVEVRKRRRLWMYKNARIHIDEVENLGHFIEFEVMVTKGRAQAQRLYKELVTRFGIRSHQMIAESYSDLLMKATRQLKRLQ